MGKHVLAFLSMKRFHPARQDNQYKLFKAEADHKNLIKKQKEYQKIYEEEQRELLDQQREADLKKKLITEEEARKQKIVNIHQKKKTRRGRGKKKKNVIEVAPPNENHQQHHGEVQQKQQQQQEREEELKMEDDEEEDLQIPMNAQKQQKTRKNITKPQGGVLEGHSMDDMMNIQAKQAAIAGETKDRDISATGVDLGKTANVKQSVNFLYLVPPGYKESLTRQAMEDEIKDEKLEKLNDREQREQDQMYMLELQRQALAKGIPFKRSFANEDDLEEVNEEEEPMMNRQNNAMEDEDDVEEDIICERCKQRGHGEGDPMCPLGKFDPLLNRQIIAQNPYEPIEHRERTIRDVGLNIQPLESTGGIDASVDINAILGDLSVDDIPTDELLQHFSREEIEMLRDFEKYKKKYKKFKKQKKKKKKKKHNRRRERYDSDSEEDTMPSFLSSFSSSRNIHSSSPAASAPPPIDAFTQFKQRQQTPPASFRRQQRYHSLTPPPVAPSQQYHSPTPPPYPNGSPGLEHSSSFAPRRRTPPPPRNERTPSFRRSPQESSRIYKAPPPRNPTKSHPPPPTRQRNPPPPPPRRNRRAPPPPRKDRAAPSRY